MQIVITIPKLNRSILIYLLLAVVWSSIGYLVYRGGDYVIYPDTTVTAMATSKQQYNNKNVVEFELPNGETQSVSYSRTAYDKMHVGTKYYIEVPKEKTVVNCLGFIIFSFMCVIGGLVGGAFMIFGVLPCICSWTADLLSGKPFRTINDICQQSSLW